VTGIVFHTFRGTHFQKLREILRGEGNLAEYLSCELDGQGKCAYRRVKFHCAREGVHIYLRK
jgi:hypothetical protein